MHFKVQRRDLQNVYDRWSENRKEAFANACRQFDSATRKRLGLEFGRDDITQSFLYYQEQYGGSLEGGDDLAEYIASQFIHGNERKPRNPESQNITNILIHENHPWFQENIDRYIRLNRKGIASNVSATDEQTIDTLVRNIYERQLDQYKIAMLQEVASSPHSIYLLAPNEETEKEPIGGNETKALRTLQCVDSDGDTVDLGAIDRESLPAFFNATEGIASQEDGRDSFNISGSYYGQCPRAFAVQLSALLNLGMYVPCNKPDITVPQQQKQYDAAIDFVIRMSRLQNPLVDISFGVQFDSNGIRGRDIQTATRIGEPMTSLMLAFRNHLTTIIPFEDDLDTFMSEESEHLGLQRKS